MRARNTIASTRGRHFSALLRASILKDRHVLYGMSQKRVRPSVRPFLEICSSLQLPRPLTYCTVHLRQSPSTHPLHHTPPTNNGASRCYCTYCSRCQVKPAYQYCAKEPAAPGKEMLSAMKYPNDGGGCKPPAADAPASFYSTVQYVHRHDKSI